MYELDFNVLIDAMPFIIKGIEMTILISIISSVFAFIIGVIIVFLRTVVSSGAGTLATGYVEVVRNTPLLIQLYILYKGLPDFGISLPPMVCGIVALSLYTGAFISEVLRSGLNSIASQQHEAARGLGLSNLQTFKLVLFPQAIRIVIPPLTNQFINLIKNSSLVSFITVNDVFYVIYKKAVDDFRFFEFFITGAIIYMILTGFVALASNLVERKFKRLRRSVAI